MQPPRSEAALRGLDAYEQLVNTFEKDATDYWRLWGPLGEPMVRAIEAWANVQRTYLQSLRQAYGAGSQP